MATITEIFKAQKARVPRSKKQSQTPVAKAEIEEVETVDPNQQDLDFLRQFDLDSRFGPSTGISRLERWERAAKFGFDPPKEVRDVILQHKDDTKYTESVWFGMKI